MSDIGAGSGQYTTTNVEGTTVHTANGEYTAIPGDNRVGNTGDGQGWEHWSSGGTGGDNGGGTSTGGGTSEVSTGGGTGGGTSEVSTGGGSGGGTGGGSGSG